MLESPFRSALLLTAGYGQRLAPLTNVRAKPAVPVATEPLVRRIIRWLCAHGVDDLVLNLHHKPETIASVVGNGGDLGAHVRYSWEQPRILGTAGGPRHASALFDGDVFLIVNGDTLADVNLAAMAERHLSSRASVTLAVTRNHAPLRYGGLWLDEASRVTGVVPRGPAAAGSYHFLGVQIARADVFSSIPDGQTAASISGIYDTLMTARPGSIAGFIADVPFWDIGTVTDYWQTSAAFAAREHRATSFGRNARIASTAQVVRSILWDDVVVGEGAVLEECIVTDGVRVPAGAAHRRSVLHLDDNNHLHVTAFDVGDSPGPHA